MGAGFAGWKGGAAPGTGLDLLFVSRHATEFSKSLSETEMRSTGRPEPDD
jgi:hypothetical protein